MDTAATHEFVSKQWDETIIPTLCDYIKIPNQSPMFDKQWATNGLMEQAADILVKWVKAQNVPGLTLEVVKLEGRTPLVFIEVPATEASFNRTIFMYGHLDKQPPLEPWAEGLGPYNPVIRDGKLYGRGGADDGYSVFAAITALRALQLQKLPHARAVIIIEACEESGSPDLPFYIEHLKPRIGIPDLIICLDSGCGTYDQFWITTTLRGMIAGVLRVEILKEAQHSGMASGVVPSSFRIARQILSKLEDEKTGEVLFSGLQCEIPEERKKQIQHCADVLGETIYSNFKFVDGAEPVTKDPAQALANKTWKATVSVIGTDGIPSLENAGNVLRTYTSLKLSIRVPPRVSALPCARALKEFLEKDPPYGAKVTFEFDKAGSGWDAPALVPWLSQSLDNASNAFYGKPANFIGEGGSIPFMGMLGELFPQAQFCVTGVLGPNNNAHGPNEMLVIDMGKKVTSCVAKIIHDHYVEFSKNK